MKKLAIMIILGILLLTACAPAATPAPPFALGERSSKAIQPQQAPSLPQEMPAAAQDSSVVGSGTTSNNESGPIPTSNDRIVIMNADLSIVVPDPVNSVESIAKMAKAMGGYTVSSNVYKVTVKEGVETPAANITVRVLADQLPDALKQIKGLAINPQTDILTENVSGQDVTKEYTDLESQLRSEEQAKKQLETIMDQAVKTEDVMNVFNQLQQVNRNIEVLKGQIQYYQEASHLSAISVSLQSKESVQPLTIGGWRPVGVARDALQSLINLLQKLFYALEWMVIFCLPVVILVGVPLYFIIRGIVRWQQRRKTVKTGATPEAQPDQASPQKE
jgi:hypothetical protein